MHDNHFRSLSTLIEWYFQLPDILSSFRRRSLEGMDVVLLQFNATKTAQIVKTLCSSLTAGAWRRLFASRMCRCPIFFRSFHVFLLMYRIQREGVPSAGHHCNDIRPHTMTDLLLRVISRESTNIRPRVGTTGLIRWWEENKQWQTYE